MPMLDRANDLLERADKLDDAVSNLQAFRSLLEDLNARTPIDLPPPQVRAIGMVRAAILRSAIALVVAILDSKGSDRVSLGQIADLLEDQTNLRTIPRKEAPRRSWRDSRSAKITSCKRPTPKNLCHSQIY
jgi:hypothetical protein